MTGDLPTGRRSRYGPVPINDIYANLLTPSLGPNPEPVSIYMLPSSVEQRLRTPIDRLLEALGSRWNPYPFLMLEAPINQVKGRLAMGRVPMGLGTAQRPTPLTGRALENGDETAFAGAIGAIRDVSFAIPCRN